MIIFTDNTINMYLGPTTADSPLICIQFTDQQKFKNNSSIHMIQRRNSEELDWDLGTRIQTYLLFVTSEAFANDFTLKSSTFLEGKIFVILSEAGLALLVHHQNESDPHFAFHKLDETRADEKQKA